MQFFLTLAMIAAIAAALSGAIAWPLFRLNRPYARPLAVVLAIILFFVLSWAGFVILISESARRGHPF
jgi:hypothetical protein